MPHAAAPSTSPDPGTWVLLRGLTRSAGHWGEFPALLLKALPGARLLMPELPGNGALHAQRSPTRVAEMTDAVRAMLQSQRVQGPVQLLALSLGAMVACDWAQRHPQELGGAVLVNTSLRPFSPFWHRMRPEAAARLLTHLAPAAARERAVLALTSRLVAANPLRARATLAEWQALGRAEPVQAANALRQLWAAARFQAPAAAPAVPLLVLNGAADALVNPACSRRLAQAWQLPLRIHAQAGHDLPLDDGAWVAREVAQWWQAQ